MRELKIAGRRIADDEPCYVIAEIGGNHQGKLATASVMIDAAAQCGVHAVKFQKRENQTLYSRALLDQPYENENSFGPTYGLHRDAIELGMADLLLLKRDAARAGVTCFATAFDEPSADLLMELGMPAIKIASGGLTDAPLLEHVAKLRVPLIVSTGGGTWRDVDEAVNLLSRYHSRFALLHCTAAYPCDFTELNLKVIPAMRERYPETVIGWSGHDSGIAMAVAAYTLGARIIEKHFTLNRAMKGTDHAFSLEPAGMKKLVRDLVRARVALGDGVKRYYPSEVKPIAKMRRRQTAEGMRVTGEQDHVSA